MDHLTAIRLIALRTVVEETDYDYQLRKVFRWYSQNFHTPLDAVYSIPIDDVLQHYYEWNYEQIAEDRTKLEQEIQAILDDGHEDKVKVKTAKKEQDDDAFLAAVESEVEVSKPEDETKAAADAILKLTEQLKGLADGGSVDVKFNDTIDLDELMESDGIGSGSSSAPKDDDGFVGLK